MDDADRSEHNSAAELDNLLKNRVQFSGESAEACEECGEEIPPARREALPGVLFCVLCAEAEEKQNRLTNRTRRYGHHI